MRQVRHPGETIDAIRSAKREAMAAFGDGTLYVERLLDGPRHIEVQLLADGFGNIVHLFERECSTQRRHQKLIEESPSPAVTADLRRRLTNAAIAAARAARYRNAGTIEFLLDGREFYFLEMNTRLQVEHPVTEEVTGVDLVRAQLAVASGDPLPWSQASLLQRGHAIEARIYAEAPEHEFLPQAGPLLLYREPHRPGVRIDSGVTEGGHVSPHYDALLAKVIARGEDRGQALARLVEALRDFPILGVRTNIPFLLRILDDPTFRAGTVDTAFVDTHVTRLIADQPPTVPPYVAAAIAEHASGSGRMGTDLAANAGGRPSDPWDQLLEWRNR
jgi:acetyl/propionyl-CoA carboxylase alpha subunit